MNNKKEKNITGMKGDESRQGKGYECVENISNNHNFVSKSFWLKKIFQMIMT